MAGKIPSQFIDDLLNRVDVVDVINRRVPLKKAGRDYQARCPFHDEKTPSFTVSQQKQFYHCFGCGAHGSAINFLMEYENLGFVEAVEELAQAAGLEVPREVGADQGPDLRPLYGLMEKAAGFYRHQLKHHPDAKQAIDYLKARGLSGEIAAAFGIGYAPPGWDNLLTALGTDRPAMARLLECGLTQEGESKGYDRFRNRIIFPIRDRRGRTIGFGGRTIGEEKPKYLNSPETLLFHKGHELYGLYEARKANNKLSRLLVVEGYMDVVALAQHGILNAVATLGTATTHDHLELIFRTCPEVVFCFDGDRAGREAAWKALLTSLPLMRDGREVKFLFLPQGEDPDTQIRKEGPDAFNTRIEQAQPLSKFLFQHLTDQVQMESIDGRAKLAQLATPILEKLPSGVFRRMMFQHLEELVGIRDGHLDKGGQQSGQNRHRGVRQTEKQQRPTPIRMAIALLLDSPHLHTIADNVENDWQKWDAPGIFILKQLLEIIRSQPTLNKAALLERWRDTEHFNHLNKLADYRFDLPGMDLEAELRDALLKLNRQFHKISRPQPGNLRPSELPDDLLDELKRRYPGTLSQDEQ